MKFVIDENVPINIIPYLTNEGHEATTLQQLHKRSLLNGAVVQIAIKTQAILITCDTDFLNLKKELQFQARIIYIYVHPRDPRKALIKQNLTQCLNHLQNPGVMKLTTENISYITPDNLLKQRNENIQKT